MKNKLFDKVPIIIGDRHLVIVGSIYMENVFNSLMRFGSSSFGVG